MWIIVAAYFSLVCPLPCRSKDQDQEVDEEQEITIKSKTKSSFIVWKVALCW